MAGMSRKLSILSGSLVHWCGQNIGNVRKEIKKLKKELELLQNTPHGQGRHMQRQR